MISKAFRQGFLKSAQENIAESPGNLVGKIMQETKPDKFVQEMVNNLNKQLDETNPFGSDNSGQMDINSDPVEPDLDDLSPNKSKNSA